MTASKVHSHEWEVRYVIVPWGDGYDQIWYKYCYCGALLW